jgi:S1-C subfamily serine protease
LSDLRLIVDATPPGDSLHLTIARDGKQKGVEVKVQDFRKGKIDTKYFG